MSENKLAGLAVELDEGGYLINHDQWTSEVAETIAIEEGIAPLTDEHWKALDFIAKDYEERGVIPGMRRMNKVGGVPTKDLYRLFPDGPIKKAARIAGYSKPVSCV